MVSEAANGFAQAGYAILRELIPEPLHTFLCEYVLKSARAGRFTSGDSGVPATPCLFGDPFMESLLWLLLPSMETASGKRLFPTYSYLRIYKDGDVLTRHQDRPSCEISATLSLGYQAPSPWPIWIEVGGVAKSVALEPGDALLYKGIEVPHWREQFAGTYSAQVFLHYVDQHGPHKNLRYDQRDALATSPMTIRILEQLMTSATAKERNS